MHLEVLTKHLKLLIATLVLLRVHWLRYLVLRWLVSADKFELLLMPLVSDGLLSTDRCYRRYIFLYDHVRSFLFGVEADDCRLFRICHRRICLSANTAKLLFVFRLFKLLSSHWGRRLLMLSASAPFYFMKRSGAIFAFFGSQLFLLLYLLFEFLLLL